MSQAETRVLACVDPSHFANFVVDYGAWAASRLSARLDLLHVIDRHLEIARRADHSGAIGIDAKEHLLSDLSERDEAAVRRLVENHAARTDSERAADLLADWPAAVSEFAVVMPDAYRDAIDERPEADARRSLPASAREDPSLAGSAD